MNRYHVTHSKKYPLEHDALIVTSSGEAEETFLVVLADEVKEDSGAFKDNKGLWFMLAVNKDGNATVGVQSNEPWFLLTVGGDVYFLDSARGLDHARVCNAQGGLTRSPRRRHMQL